MHKLAREVVVGVPGGWGGTGVVRLFGGWHRGYGLRSTYIDECRGGSASAGHQSQLSECGLEATKPQRSHLS